MPLPSCLTMGLKAVEVVGDLRRKSSDWGPQGKSDFLSFGLFGDLVCSLQVRSPCGSLLACCGSDLSYLLSCCCSHLH